MPVDTLFTLLITGVVLRGDTNEVLVVQDKFKPAVWKFPGGLSEFAEDIGEHP